MKVAFLCEEEMNDAALVGVHWSKGEGHACGANTFGGMTSHRAQFGFTGGAKIFDIANDAFAPGQLSSEGLIEQVLKRFEQLAAFVEQQRSIGPVNIEEAS